MLLITIEERKIMVSFVRWFRRKGTVWIWNLKHLGFSKFCKLIPAVPHLALSYTLDVTSAYTRYDSAWYINGPAMKQLTTVNLLLGFWLVNNKSRWLRQHNLFILIFLLLLFFILFFISHYLIPNIIFELKSDPIEY